MNLNTEDSLSFHQYLKSGIPFAYFRLPGDSHIHFIAQSDTKLYTTQNLDDLNGQEGFVVAPFSADSASPVCLIRADIREKYNCQIAPQNASFASAKIVDIANDYSEKFDLFRKALTTGEFDKLVLSRKQEHNIPTSFNIWDSFIKACQIYPNSYIYLLYTPQTGLWMGSSPEILLSGYQGKWRTVALAGTQSLKEDSSFLTWDNKNMEEQKYVSSYIRRQLNSINIDPVENGPYSVNAGKLVHLRTDFEFKVTDPTKLGALLKLLHPTPAVCGLPKEDAYDFILKNEGYNRKYYSGFIGELQPDGITNLYVNLRCLSLDNDKLTLYAGGGLLAASEKEDEWIETEKKMCTMLNIINNEY